MCNLFSKAIKEAKKKKKPFVRKPLFSFFRFHNIILHKVLLSTTDKVLQEVVLYGNYSICVHFSYADRHNVHMVANSDFHHSFSSASPHLVSKLRITAAEKTSTRWRNYSLHRKSWKSQKKQPMMRRRLHHSFSHSSMKSHLPDCCFAVMSYSNNCIKLISS